MAYPLTGPDHFIIRQVEKKKCSQPVTKRCSQTNHFYVEFGFEQGMSHQATLLTCIIQQLMGIREILRVLFPRVRNIEDGIRKCLHM